MREMDPIRDVGEYWSPPIDHRDVARGFSLEKI